MADLTTIVLQLQADVEEASAAFEAFASQMESQFNELENSVNDHFDGVQKKATETADHLTKEGKRGGEGFRAGIEVAIGTLGLSFIMALRRAFDEGERMTEQFKTLSAITGDSAPKLMQMQYALTQLGIPAENVRTILTMLEAHIGRAGIAANQGVGPLHALGLSIASLQNKDSITQLEIIADRFTQLGPQAQKAGAQMLFGFRGEVMLPLLQQGAEGVKRLVDAFKPPDPAIFAAFDRLNIDTKALSMTWLSFAMEVLRPVLDLMIRVTDAATTFINRLREMSAETKLEVLLAALATATVSFEILTTLIGSFLVQSAAMRGLIVILQDFGRSIGVIAIAAVVVAAAWKSNWGNIRDVVLEVFDAFEAKTSGFRAEWDAIVAQFDSVVIPAIQRLGVAISNLITPMADSAYAALQNRDAWQRLDDILKTAIDWLGKLVDALTYVVNNARAFGTFILDVLVALAIPRLLAGLVAVRDAILAIDFAYLLTPLGLLQAAFIATGLAILAFQTNFDGLRDKILNALDGLADFIDGLADLNHAVALVTTGGLIDWFDRVALHAKTASDQIHGMATSLRGFVIQQREAQATGPNYFKTHPPYTGPDIAAATAGGWVTAEPPPKTTPGGGGLTPDVKAGAAHKAFQDWLAGLEAKLVPAKIALANLEGQFSKLEAQLKLLGSITPTNLWNALHILGLEAGVANKELTAQNALVRQLEANLAAVQAKMPGTKDPEERRTLAQQELTLTNEINAEKTKQVDLEVKVKEAQKARITDIGDAYKTTLDDENKSYAQRIAAGERWLTLATQYGAKLFEQDAISKDILKVEQERVDAVSKLATAQAGLVEARAKLEAAEAGPIPSHAEKLKTLYSDYEAAITRETDDRKTAQAELDLLNEQLRRMHLATITSVDDLDKLNPALMSAITNNSTLNGLYEKAVSSTTAYINSQTAATDALNKYNAELSVISDQLAKNWDQLAKQVGGPVYTAIVGFTQWLQRASAYGQTWLVSLQSAFIQLAEKTLAYKDVEVTVMEITTALAKILNTLRPVMDFFLGILIGITNVFISMYDVLATILDVFGAMITKIKLLNSDLQNMNVAAVPLIKIIHDLPTLPEFNRGYWTQLIGEQDAMNNNLNNLNSDILNGFDKTMSKLGEIVGILIAIKFLLGMMGVNLLGSNQSWFSAIGNWWNRMFPSGGAPPVPTGAPGGAAPGSMTVPGASSYGSYPGGLSIGDFITATSTGVQNGITAAALTMTTPLPVVDPATFNAANDANTIAQQQLEASQLAATSFNDTATNTANHAATGVSTLGMIGKVAGGIADLYGVVSGYLTGGPMGGVEAGLGASGLMSLFAPAFAAGPYGIAAAAAIGLGALIFGGHFGPNPANEPDVYNTQTWGQLNANLWGAGVGQFSNMPMMAAGQAFSMSSSLAQATGGMGLLQFIAAFMQSGSGLNVLGPRLAAIFSGLSTTSTDVISGKNGILDLLNGVQMNFQQLYSTSYNAFQLIEKYLNGATSGAQQFSNAMNINLAEVYGPHTAARGAGGAAGAAASMTNPINMTVNFNGNNYALNGEEVYNQLKPVFQQLLLEYQQQQALYTRSTPFAFSRGLSYS